MTATEQPTTVTVLPICYRPGEAAAMLGLTRSQVIERVRSGRLPGFRLPGFAGRTIWRVDGHAVAEAVAA